jgi:hypothetical protein
MEDIILASSKPWHVLNFNKLKKNKLFNWFYVATPQKLDAILKKFLIQGIYFFYIGTGKSHQIFFKIMNAFVFI